MYSTFTFLALPPTLTIQKLNINVFCIVTMTYFVHKYQTTRSRIQDYINVNGHLRQNLKFNISAVGTENWNHYKAILRICIIKYLCTFYSY
jgi:hypothetical protein